ncbi:MAG: hypothetical protein F4Z14_00525 [Gammaproteobacteria bacterium]|nr:hypothetical protein [Gammaproteobacteria bacterium]
MTASYSYSKCELCQAPFDPPRTDRPYCGGRADGKACPPSGSDEIHPAGGGKIDAQDLADVDAWLSGGECPPEAIQAAVERAVTLCEVVWSHVQTLEIPPDAAGKIADYAAKIVAADVRRFKTAGDVYKMAMDVLNDTHLWLGLLPDRDRLAMSGSLDKIRTTFARLEKLTGLDLSEHDPTAPVLDAWRNRPADAQPNTRPDRIFPTKLAQVFGSAAEKDAKRRNGQLFTPAAHAAADGKGGQLVLPGFERPDVTGPCLPLGLYDLGAGKADKWGGFAAPLGLRIWIEAVLSLGLYDRDGSPRRLRILYRDFLARLWDGRIPKPRDRNARITAAFDALDSSAALIPWRDPDGKGGLWRVVRIVNRPVSLDDTLILDVDLPPGSGPGPVVSPRLGFYGVRSALAYRALLNLAFAWFDPGRNLIPASRTDRAPWVHVQDPDAYPSCTDRELLALCYPATADATGQLKRKQLERARKTLRGLEADGEIRIERGRILPPA